MKNVIYKTALLLILMNGINAQSFQKGQVDLNLGVGVGSTFTGPGNTNSMAPLNVSLGYGITNDVSLGVYLGYSQATYNYGGWEDAGHGNEQYYIDTYKWTYFILGAQADYHFGRFIKIDKLDVYAGLLLGDDFAHSSYYTTSPYYYHEVIIEPTYGGLVLALHAGARYRFTNHVGVFAEVGYGVTYLNLGVNFKF